MFVLRIALLFGVVFAVRASLLDNVGDVGDVGSVVGKAGKLGNKAGLVDTGGLLGGKKGGKKGKGGKGGLGPLTGQVAGIKNVIENNPADVVGKTGSIIANQGGNINQKVGEDVLEEIPHKAAMDVIAGVIDKAPVAKGNKKKQSRKGKKARTTTTTPEPDDDDDDDSDD